LVGALGLLPASLAGRVRRVVDDLAPNDHGRRPAAVEVDRVLAADRLSCGSGDAKNPGIW
jgi:hypothetical protein